MNGLLVFGRTGQVARELARLAPEARFLGRDEADLSDPDACARAIRDAGCQAVINAAAYTAVDRAETEPDLAGRVNAAAPAAMAGAAWSPADGLARAVARAAGAMDVAQWCRDWQAGGRDLPDLAQLRASPAAKRALWHLLRRR